jgi:hypothetical protein
MPHPRKRGPRRGRAHRQPARHRRLGVAAAIAGIVLDALPVALRGYPPAGRVVVRCRQGHLFTTLWIPGASFKSIRLGWMRYQRCPVGNHWSLVQPVSESELSEAERADAYANRDAPIP